MIKSFTYKKIILTISLTILLSLTIFILNIKFTLNFKPLYYMDINKLNIEETSTLNTEDIKLNYNYVIHYVQTHKNINFSLPTLSYSNEGKIHFEEVKVIFNFLDYLLLCSFFLLIIIFIFSKNKPIKTLKWSSVLLTTTPLIYLIPIILDFDKSFNVLHSILFNNDYWLLDCRIDPIINIFPQEFFFHCSLLIILLNFISSYILNIIYKKVKK